MDRSPGRPAEKTHIAFVGCDVLPRDIACIMHFSLVLFFRLVKSCEEVYPLDPTRHQICTIQLQTLYDVRGQQKQKR
jgi:hypothetical protein